MFVKPFYTLIKAATFQCLQQTISQLSVTSVIRELCEHISHSCLIFLMTLGDVLLSLSADVLGMFIMQCFDIVVLSVCVRGCSAGVSSEHEGELRVYLLVCGLRRVKDPLYLLEAFSGTELEGLASLVRFPFSFQQ